MELSLGFLITQHYYSKQYGVSVGGQLIFGLRASLKTPLWIVSIHLFYFPLCVSSLLRRSQHHIARGSQRPSSDQCNRLYSLRSIYVASAHA